MFYLEKAGECVNQIETINAATWEEAKASAWNDMGKGDILAECEKDAIIDQYNGEYHTINEDKAQNYAQLERGVWIDTPDGGEDFREDIWYWSDEPEEYLNADGEPYDFESMTKEYENKED